MHTQGSPKERKTYLKHRLFGKRVKSNKLFISDKSTDFFEDIPLYRNIPHKKLAKKHLARSRKSKTTEA